MASQEELPQPAWDCIIQQASLSTLAHLASTSRALNKSCEYARAQDHSRKDLTFHNPKNVPGVYAGWLPDGRLAVLSRRNTERDSIITLYEVHQSSGQTTPSPDFIIPSQMNWGEFITMKDGTMVVIDHQKKMWVVENMKTVRLVDGFSHGMRFFSCPRYNRLFLYDGKIRQIQLNTGKIEGIVLDLPKRVSNFTTVMHEIFCGVNGEIVVVYYDQGGKPLTEFVMMSHEGDELRRIEVAIDYSNGALDGLGHLYTKGPSGIHMYDKNGSEICRKEMESPHTWGVGPHGLLYVADQMTVFFDTFS